MNSVYDRFSTLWPNERRDSLKPILSQILVMPLPLPRVISPNLDKRRAIVVASERSISEMMQAMERGFSHVVQREREDFAQEILASSLMIMKPAAFSQNPLPFFFSGFNPSTNLNNWDQSLLHDFASSDEKPEIISWLSQYLDKNPRTKRVSDLCLQIADEMLTNAIFNAPAATSADGEIFHPYAKPERTRTVRYPEGKQARFFACYRDEKIYLGCEDPWGSVVRAPVLQRLLEVYSVEEAAPREGAGGAGLGLKFMIDNSSNFYMHCERGRRTLVACGLQLDGLKANLSAAKHLHISLL